jgi:hypothetical protein
LVGPDLFFDAEADGFLVVVVEELPVFGFPDEELFGGYAGRSLVGGGKGEGEW